MPRPPKTRMVSGYPVLPAFVPEGLEATGEVALTVEEFEALRLSDFEGLDQETAAGLMGVSRQTYGRILARARSRVAEALVTVKALRVAGGNFHVRRRRGFGGGRRGHGRGWRGGRRDVG